MEQYYECSVRYEKILENGTRKKVSEKYLVNAMSFTEAESKMTGFIALLIAGEFDIFAIKRDNVSEIALNDDKDKFYRCKVNLITLDEKTGTEKKSPIICMVMANNSVEAEESLKKLMKGTITDWETHTIAESPVLDLVS